MNRYFCCLSKLFFAVLHCLWCQPQPSAVGPVAAPVFATAGCGNGWRSPTRETELCLWKTGSRRGEQTAGLCCGEGFLKQARLTKVGEQEKRGKVQVMGFGEGGNEQCGNMQYSMCGFAMPACEAGGFSRKSRDREHSGCNVAPTSRDKCQLC